MSDLHLGKCETLAAAGLPVPPGVIEHDLGRLELLLRRTGAQRILVIGDLLHAPAGLAEPMIEQVGSWRRRTGVAWELIPGNHDRRVDRVASEWGLLVRGNEWMEQGIGFGHDPAEAHCSAGLAGASGIWTGHVHPAVRLRGNGDRVLLPCFCFTGRVCVLPAFSMFTGGVAIDHHDPEVRAYAIAEGSVLDVRAMFPPRGMNLPAAAPRPPVRTRMRSRLPTR